MHRRGVFRAGWVVVLVSLALTGWVRAEPPSSQPTDTTERGGAGGGRLAEMMIDRARQALNDVNLSAEQKTKIDDIVAKAKEKLESMRADIEKSGGSVREHAQEFREFGQKLREDVLNELTEEQKAKFQQKMAGGMARAQDFLGRLRESLQKLDLTDEQKTEFKELMEGTRSKAEAIRKEAAGDGEALRSKLRELATDAQEKAKNILTPEQREKVRDLIQQDRPAATQPAATQPVGEAPKRDIAPAAPPGKEVGEAAPNFELRKLDGNPVQLSSFKGRVLVMEFGSISSPAFRSRVEGMERLKQQRGEQAAFLIVYTKEAHPKGGWEVDRNKEEGFLVEQPKDDAGRRALATDARNRLKISLPIAVDGTDNATADAYGGFPNGAVVVGKDGRIAAVQKWTDPDGLRRIIDEAARR